ncbi:MAG: type I methionyl aminopeptidase [Candidatus Dojkabacteria bacterium]|nr:type I methionyl aminopeptidase [Candidatus Dojkabacteria bacterium]
MIIKSAKQEKTYREAGRISSDILGELGHNVKVGVTPLEIEALANDLCREYDVKPSFKTVEDYNYATCISVNDCILHGIPNDIPFKEGDLVKIDFGIIYKGLFTDHCWTWGVGNVSNEDRKLMKAGREAVENGCSVAVTSNHTGDISNQFRSTAKKYGYTTLSDFAGHGIGKSLHGEPDIYSFGDPGTGERLKDGMVICIECQVTKHDAIYIADNGWNVMSSYGEKGSMYEYLGIVRDHQFIKLTDSF